MKGEFSCGGFLRAASAGVGALIVASICARAAFSAETAAKGKDPSARDQWEEEILLQLSEMRKSQGELTKQVAELRAEVQSLRTAPVAKPAPALTFDLRNKAFPVLGSAKAQVAIVEFSDFECPYCLRHYKNTVPGITSKYLDTGKAKYVFVDFPLGFHSRAEPSAIAAACAHQQDAFWKMHDQLFVNQSALSEQTFLKLASDLKLNTDKFTQCLRDPKTAAQVRSFASLGESVGVEGTPAFLIGRIRNGVLTDGKFVSGAQSLATFEKIVDSFLPAAGK